MPRARGPLAPPGVLTRNTENTTAPSNSRPSHLHLNAGGAARLRASPFVADQASVASDSSCWVRCHSSTARACLRGVLARAPRRLARRDGIFRIQPPRPLRLFAVLAPSQHHSHRVGTPPRPRTDIPIDEGSSEADVGALPAARRPPSSSSPLERLVLDRVERRPARREHPDEITGVRALREQFRPGSSGLSSSRPQRHRRADHGLCRPLHLTPTSGCLSHRFLWLCPARSYSRDVEELAPRHLGMRRSFELHQIPAPGRLSSVRDLGFRMLGRFASQSGMTARREASLGTLASSRAWRCRPPP